MFDGRAHRAFEQRSLLERNEGTPTPHEPSTFPSGRARNSCVMNGQVTHAEHNGVHVLRYFGRLNYMSAPAIQRFLDDLIQHAHIAGLVFDLTEAESLDSTNLGLLARVNERVKDVASSESMIVARAGDVRDVLLSMGFDQTFDIVTDGPEPATLPPAHAGSAIATPLPSHADLHDTMLGAHRALVRLSDAGRVQFEPVVACLESDLPRH